MEQEIKLIVLSHGVLTREVGPFIVLEPLGQIGPAFGVVERARGLILLGNGRVRFAFQLAASVKEVLKLMKPVTHPSRVWARRVITRHQAQTPIGGHADAVEAMIAQGVKMGFPGLGRAIRGQLYFQNGRAVRLNRDQDGLMTGKNLIAQIKHHGALCHRKGRRERSPVVLEAFTEIPHGIGLVLEVL